jgi:hypothetical protein
MKILKLATISLSVSAIISFTGCDSQTVDLKDNASNISTDGFSATTNTFTVNGSNLTWQDNDELNNNKQYYSNIENYCSNLVLDGYDDWRVPTNLEYRNDLYPNKDNLKFSYSYDNYIFWTSTYIETSDRIVMYNLSNDYYVFFTKNNIEVYKWGLRCVRDN